ncbi:hypothetical protein CUMW_204680 [Citrus unshiu]|uniref:Uncharacterized protein n=1 Tax=Citrus unshiu TaxID=55188 RepID=A0A2H5Q809_CITUN|nr:hypothetical protein CUMW_204680 [Citrus unshiu]
MGFREAFHSLNLQDAHWIRPLLLVNFILLFLSEGNNTLAGVGSSIRAPPSSETAKQGKQVPAFYGITDFAEVYSFIGSSFDLAPKAIMKAQRNESLIFLKQ